jgi:hypothetical protein
MASTQEHNRTRLGVAIAVLYCTLSIVFAVLYLLAPLGTAPPDVYVPYVRPLWNASSDPVLAFLIRLVVVIVGVALIPGMIAAMIAFVVLVAALAVLLGAFDLLFYLAALSPVGAILVFGSLAFFFWWLLFRVWPEQTYRALDFIVAVFGLYPNVGAFMSRVRG